MVVRWVQSGLSMIGDDGYWFDDTTHQSWGQPFDRAARQPRRRRIGSLAGAQAMLLLADPAASFQLLARLNWVRFAKTVLAWLGRSISPGGVPLVCALLASRLVEIAKWQ